ncbi:MAG: 6-phosphofructokinase [Oscillospiraceae bacterium]|jgi:6-phosphofructokinase 1|nr:6-phosphofructokinase [Oscillospiraceae bacterium]
MKRIGVLTSGGDAPGMNAAIRAVVRTGISKGMTVLGVRRGYNGLILDRTETPEIEADIVELSVRSVSDIIQRGGTLLYSARCQEFRYESGLQKAKATCERHGIEGLVVIGGDGSFRGAADLSARGIACVGIPGTIDNDIAMTDYTIGYDTAMNTAMELVDKLRDTAQSHDRCTVVEVMGRNAGYIALNTGVSCGATAILTRETGTSAEDVITRIKNTQTTGKHHFIVVMCEGVGNAAEVAKEIEKHTGVESRASVLGHVQRGGSPTVRDRVAASRLGHRAVELLSNGIGNRVVGFDRNELVDFDIQDALRMTKEFDFSLYNVGMDISF